MNLYSTRYRPVGLGTIPKIHWSWVEQPKVEMFRPLGSDLPISSRSYGVFQTDRPLTPEELYAFEIDEVSS